MQRVVRTCKGPGTSLPSTPCDGFRCLLILPYDSTLPTNTLCRRRHACIVAMSIAEFAAATDVGPRGLELREVAHVDRGIGPAGLARQACVCGDRHAVRVDLTRLREVGCVDSLFFVAGAQQSERRKCGQQNGSLCRDCRQFAHMSSQKKMKSKVKIRMINWISDLGSPSNRLGLYGLYSLSLRPSDAGVVLRARCARGRGGGRDVGGHVVGAEGVSIIAG